jgi:hypothetical protein
MKAVLFGGWIRGQEVSSRAYTIGNTRVKAGRAEVSTAYSV